MRLIGKRLDEILNYNDKSGHIIEDFKIQHNFLLNITNLHAAKNISEDIMRTKLKVEIANFVCTYDNNPLLSQFERFHKSISKPKDIIWSKGETKAYRFIQVKLVKFKNDIFLIGRLVKKITHTSSQLLKDDEEALERKEGKLKDHPSSAFMLRLYDHKLVIVKETRKAPVSSDFKIAITKLLKENDKENFEHELSKYKKKLDRLRLNVEEKTDFLNWYYATYPNFNLSITTIGSPDVKTIFKNVKLINKYVLKIPHSNDENPNVKNSFMKTLSKQRVLAGRDKTTDSELLFRDKEGLNKDFVKDLTKNAGSSGGTFGFHMVGKTNDDEKVNVSENDIKVTYEVESSSDLKTIAERATSKFNSLVESGDVTLAKMKDEEEMRMKANKIYNALAG